MTRPRHPLRHRSKASHKAPLWILVYPYRTCRLQRPVEHKPDWYMCIMYDRPLQRRTSKRPRTVVSITGAVVQSPDKLINDMKTRKQLGLCYLKYNHGDEPFMCMFAGQWWRWFKGGGGTVFPLAGSAYFWSGPLSLNAQNMWKTR